MRLVKQRAVQEHVEDITQDILLKIFISIKKFEQRSLLTTWIYRITLNHLFHYKANLTPSFDKIDKHDGVLTDSLDNDQREEMKSEIFFGMTLCLDAEQRMAITLADIFKLDHNAAGKIMNISPANFRKRLSRSRTELKNFLANQCGLMNKMGSCRCKLKTKSFTEKGWVSKTTHTFNKEYIQSVTKLVAECERK